MSEQFGSVTFPFVLGITTSNNFTRNVSQTIFTQTVGLETIFREAADRIFFFGAYPGPLGGPTGEIGQVADTNFVYEDVEQTVFTQIAGINQEVNVFQYIGFTDIEVRDVTQTFFSRFATDPAKSRAGVITEEDVTDSFSWNDHDGDVAFEALQRVYPADQTLGFSQTLLNTPEVDDLFQQIFATGQTADVDNTTDFGGEESQTFLKQHVAFSVQGGTCPEKEYTPFVGESGDTSYDEVPTTPPVLGSATLTLTHPRLAPTTTLTLKNPEFGNADVIRFTKIDRLTRGGDRKFFSDSGWGQTQSFELEVANVCDTTATIDEILDFLNTSLGEEIGLLDWENRQWKGIIVAPETDVTPQVGGHRVRIIFEGELI